MKAKEEKVVSTNKKTLTSNTTKQTKPEKETKPAEKPVKKAASTKTSNAKVNEKPTKTTEKSMGIYRVVFDKVNRRWQIKRDGAERVITSFLTTVIENNNYNSKTYRKYMQRNVYGRCKRFYEFEKKIKYHII